MSKYLIIIVAALILMGLGGFLIQRFGVAKFHEGFNKAIAESNANAAMAANESSRELERVENETAHMSDTDIDNELRRLGVMRDIADR